MRKNINMLIAFISTILAILGHITGIFGVIPVIFLFLGFNIICLISYRESRLFIAYHVIMILYICGYYVFFYGVVSDPQIANLFRAFMDFGNFILVIIAFALTFTYEKNRKIVQGLFLIVVWALVFHSTYTIVILNNIAAFVGPERIPIERAQSAFYIAGLILWGLIAFLQVYLINAFDLELTRREFRTQKRLKDIDEMYY